MRVIEVFIRNTKVPAGTFQTYEFSTPGHQCTKKPIIAPILESVLPEKHKQAVEIAERVAKEKGMKLKICDLSTRMGKMRALLKGVKETPTIIIENHKISEEIAERQLLSLLK